MIAQINRLASVAALALVLVGCSATNSTVTLIGTGYKVASASNASGQADKASLARAKQTCTTQHKKLVILGSKTRYQEAGALAFNGMPCDGYENQLSFRCE